MNETYFDTNHKEISKKEFLALRDEHVQMYSHALYEMGTDYIQLIDPRNITVITNKK